MGAAIKLERLFIRRHIHKQTWGFPQCCRSVSLVRPEAIHPARYRNVVSGRIDTGLPVEDRTSSKDPGWRRAFIPDAKGIIAELMRFGLCRLRAAPGKGSCAAACDQWYS